MVLGRLLRLGFTIIHRNLSATARSRTLKPTRMTGKGSIVYEYIHGQLSNTCTKFYTKGNNNIIIDEHLLVASSPGLQLCVIEGLGTRLTFWLVAYYQYSYAGMHGT